MRRSRSIAPSLRMPLSPRPGSGAGLCCCPLAVTTMRRRLSTAPTVLNPGLVSAWLAKGQVAYLEKRYDDALVAWNRALDLNPDQSAVAAACLRVKLHQCDWTDFESGCASGQVIGPKREARLTVHVRRDLVDIGRAASMRAHVGREQLSSPEFAGLARRALHSRPHPPRLSFGRFSRARDRVPDGGPARAARPRALRIDRRLMGSRDDSPMRKRSSAPSSALSTRAGAVTTTSPACWSRLEVDVAVDLKGHTTGSRRDPGPPPGANPGHLARLPRDDGCGFHRLHRRRPLRPSQGGPPLLHREGRRTCPTATR